MEKKKNNKKQTIEVVLVIVAVIVGILIYEFIYPSFRTCIGCGRTSWCSQTIKCDCKENSKTCDCQYYDGNQELKDIKCPNNQLKITNDVG